MQDLAGWVTNSSAATAALGRPLVKRDPSPPQPLSVLIGLDRSLCQRLTAAGSANPLASGLHWISMTGIELLHCTDVLQSIEDEGCLRGFCDYKHAAGRGVHGDLPLLFCQVRAWRAARAALGAPRRDGPGRGRQGPAL